MGIEPDGRLATIAGQVPLADVMERLCRSRPVLHSEADLHFSFALTLREIAHDVHCRFGVLQPGATREYVDLLCIGPHGHTVVEFKYFTRAWTGTAGSPAEKYVLKEHGARDVARRGFISDIERLERFCEGGSRDGIALLLTNEPTLWMAPLASARRTRDVAFRIHEGQKLHGTLLWADGDYADGTQVLRGRYEMRWHTYSHDAAAWGELRYVAAQIKSGCAD